MPRWRCDVSYGRGPPRRNRQRTEGPQLRCVPTSAASSHIPSSDTGPLTAWNDANVTVAFEHSEPYVAYFGHISVKTDVLEDVVLAEAIAGRNGVIELTVPDNHITASLDQKA